jgi:hypothetical protein
VPPPANCEWPSLSSFLHLGYVLRGIRRVTSARPRLKHLPIVVSATLLVVVQSSTLGCWVDGSTPPKVTNGLSLPFVKYFTLPVLMILVYWPQFLYWYGNRSNSATAATRQPQQLANSNGPRTMEVICIWNIHGDCVSSCSLT